MGTEDHNRKTDREGNFVHHAACITKHDASGWLLSHWLLALPALCWRSSRAGSREPKYLDKRPAPPRDCQGKGAMFGRQKSPPSAVQLTGLHCCAPCPTQLHHRSRTTHLRAPLVYRAPRIVARASSCVMVWATENHRVAIDRKRDGEGEYRSSRCVHHEARCVRTALTALAACTAGGGGRPALDHVNPSVSINGQRRSETVKKRGKCLVVKNPLQTGPPERRPAH
jgi:hypothetical protein